MNTTFKNSIFVTLVTTIMVLTGCKKDFDSPPITVLPTGNIISIDSLRKIYTSFDSTIVGDYSVFGTVTADELSGNLYKTIYIQDGTAGILLKLTAASDKTFFQGDKVRVSLRGTIISRYKNMIQLTNVNPDVNLIKQGKGDEIAPKVVTIADLEVGAGIYSPYQGQLIQLNNVEFSCNDFCGLYGYPLPSNQSALDRTLTDSLGQTVIVRTSGYANFSGIHVAQGRGSLIAIVSQYNSIIQLTLRKLEDVNLTGARKITCTPCPILTKDFNDQSITSGGWTTKLIYGSSISQWGIYAASNSAGKVTNKITSTTSDSCDSWLISPSINLSNASSPKLTFNSNCDFNVSANPKLELLISTNYNGVGDPTNATWTTLTATWDTVAGWGPWISSGVIDLNSFKQSNVHIAYRLQGTTAQSCTWEVDNIIVQD